MTDYPTEKIHVDLVGVMAGVEVFLGHKDIELDMTPNSGTRLRQLASLMMELAWQVEERADRYDNFKPRCFRTKLGDTWFEVAPDLFQDGENLEEAQSFYLSGNPGVSLERLQECYPDIEEVN